MKNFKISIFVKDSVVNRSYSDYAWVYGDHNKLIVDRIFTGKMQYIGNKRFQPQYIYLRDVLSCLEFPMNLKDFALVAQLFIDNAGVVKDTWYIYRNHGYQSLRIVPDEVIVKQLEMTTV